MKYPSISSVSGVYIFKNRFKRLSNIPIQKEPIISIINVLFRGKLLNSYLNLVNEYNSEINNDTISHLEIGIIGCSITIILPCNNINPVITHNIFLYPS